MTHPEQSFATTAAEFREWVAAHTADLLLGSTEQLTRELGQRLIDVGTIPRVPANFSSSDDE